MHRPTHCLAVVTLLACASALPAAASAAVTGTAITSPADGFAPVFDWLDGHGPHSIIVGGTATGSGNGNGDKVDVICQRRGEPLVQPPAVATQVIAQDVPVTTVGSGASAVRTFSVSIDAAAPGLRTPCRLRATLPNAAAGFDTTRFSAGPALFPSGLRDLRELSLANPNVGTLYDVDVSTVTPGRTSAAHIQSFGGCGLWDARPLDPGVGPDVAALNVFDCAGYADDVADATSPTRSELQVDGRNAFTGAMVAASNSAVTSALPLVPGRPALVRTATRDDVTGLLHITESTDVVRCQTAPPSYPVTVVSNCGVFVSTGVRMIRDATMSADGRVTTMRDRWESTDGADHVLDLLFEVDLSTQRYGIRLPWTGADVAAYPGSASLPGPPSVPASIFVASDRGVAAGDLAHPTGAVTFSTAPTSVEFVSGVADPSRFMELRYLRPVAADTPLELTHTFSMASTAAESAALAAAAEDSYGGPSVAITGPAGGSTVGTPSVTVTGTASDNRAVTDLSVGGTPVTVGADGGWSAEVALAPGANTIVARATDGAGNAAEAAIALTYLPTGPAAPAIPCIVPRLKGLKTPASAVAPLRKAGCRLGRSLEVYSKPHTLRKGRQRIRVVTKRFTVLGSKQKQGTRLDPGARVDLIVQGPKPRGLTPKQQAAARRQALLQRKAAAKRKREAARKPKLPVYVPDVAGR